MAIRVKREPGPMLESPLAGGGGSGHRICYICGGPGGAFSLHSRPRDRGSYFPFIEQHEIPYGAEQLLEDGLVQACMLCYSLLGQQWESFERTRTPHSKRVYWLKRADNGHYVGGEMRLQGEYAAQMIGVSPDVGLVPSGSNSHSHYGGSTGGSPAVRHHHHQQQGSGSIQQGSATVQHQVTTASRGNVDGSYYASRDTNVGSRSSSAVPPPYHQAHDRDVATASVLLDLRSGGMTSAAARTSSSLGGTPCGSPRSFRSRGDIVNDAVGKLEVAVPPSAPASGQANGVLDLSMPDKNEKSEACYLCGAEVLRSDLVPVFAKPVPNCPFFPSLMHHPRQSHSRPMDYSGRVQACVTCHLHLLQQWDVFQHKNVPHPERRYQLRQPSPAGLPPPLRAPSPPPRSPPPPPSSVPPQSPDDFICFLCGQEFHWSLRHFLYTGTNPDGEPPLPFLERVKPSRGALPFSPAGRALACGSCHRAIHRKRPTFQGISDESRSQPLQPSHQQNRAPSSSKVTASMDGRSDSSPTVNTSSREPDRPLLSCQACRRPIQPGHLKVIEFLPHREPGRPFHPYTATRLYMSDGERGGAPVCSACFSVYLAQFDAFEEEAVPHQHRRYVLAAPRPHHHQQQLTLNEDGGGSRGAVSPPPYQPVGRDGYPSVPASLHPDVGLRIRVPSPIEQDYSTSQQQHHHHLLTTVSTSVSSSPVSTISVGQPAPAPSSNALDLTGGTPVTSTGRPTRSNVSSPGPRSTVTHARPSSSFVCYVCGLRSRASERPYLVRTYPPPPKEGSSPGPVVPFFPSLTMHVTPPEAAPAAEDGTVASCVFCFHALLLQWSSYELSPRRPADRNPWLRPYDCHDFVCYICGVTTYRKRVRRISVLDFPFLVEHPRPPGSLVLDGGDGVAVCLMCYDTLSAQWNDFERMKVPLELRKYNWIAAPPPPEDDEGRVSSPIDAPQPPPGNNDGGLSNHHHLEDEQHQSGFPTSRRSIIEQESSSRRPSMGSLHGSKPIPPLTGSLQSVSNGTSLKSVSHHSTANVPPLSQASPGGHHVNAAKSSSFAAALRKLAEQATDPVDKDLSPVSSASPPCSAPGPKRAPPPLILSSDVHHPSISMSSGFASPPPSVVASSSSQPSHHLIYGDGGRKSLDHSHVTHGRPRGEQYDDIHLASDSRHAVEQDDGRHAANRVDSGGPSPGPSYGDRETSASSLGRRSCNASFRLSQPHHHHHSVSEFSPVDKTSDGAGSSAHTMTYGERGRDELRYSNSNGLLGPHTQQPLPPHLRLHPQSLPSGLPPRMEDHYVTAGSSSSFHPYRSSEDGPPRMSAHVTSPYEGASTAFGYHPSAFITHPLPQPPFRLDEHLYLDPGRYGLLRPPMYPVGHHPGVLPPSHHALPFMTSSPRYAPDLIQHPLGLVSPPANHHQTQERLKQEDGDQQPRRDYYQDLTKRERKPSGSDGNVAVDRDRRQKSPWGGHSRMSESPVHSAGGIGSIMQGTPRDLVTHKGPPTSWPGSVSATPPPLGGGTVAPTQPLTSYSLRNPGRPLAEGQDNHVHQRRSGVVNTVGTAKNHYNVLMAEGSDRSTYDSGDNIRSRLAGNGSDYSVDSRLTSMPSGRPNNRSPNTASSNSGHSQSAGGGGGLRGVSAFHHVSNLAPSSEGGSRHVDAKSPNREMLNGPREWENGVRHDFFVDPRSVKDAGVHQHQRVTAWNPEPYDSAPAASRMITTTTKSSSTLFQQDRRRRRSGSAETRVEEEPRRRLFVDVEVSWCGPAEPPNSSSPRTREGRSKLDLAEERRERLGADVTSEYSEDESEEERVGGETISRYAHLVGISSGPPLPLDTSEKKLYFMGCVGLITQKRKRELETNKFLRRHRLLRGLCLTPPDPLPEDREPPPPWYLNYSCPESPHASDLETATLENRLSAEYSEKGKIMEALNLRETSPGQRKEFKLVLKAVINEKLRRNGYQAIEDSHLYESNDAEASDIVSRGIKRKLSECGADSLSINPSKKFVPTSIETNSTSSLVPLPPRRQQTPDPALKWPASSARDFAQEFHEAVLQQTQQQSRPSPKPGGPPSAESEAPIPSDVSSTPERPRRNSEACGTPVSSRSRADHSFRWPGIEAVMEAYERHREEHKLEHNVLQEQCLRLKRSNQELSSTADALRLRMADLCNVKKDLDDDRKGRQQTIDRLKGFLKQLR